MKEINEQYLTQIQGAGALGALTEVAGIPLSVLWGAVNGDAPGPSFLTGVASGPTPNNFGGRYRIEYMNTPASDSNMPGGN